MSTKVADNTPVIIGVGQYSERVGEPGYEALSYMDLAGRALAGAIADSGASGSVAAAIDTLAAIRAFEMSRPDRKPPFGAANNVPRAIAKRVGADPKRAILTTTGGQTNQQLVGEFASAIAAGDSRCAVIVGSEAISTVLALSAKGEIPDWSEEIEGDFEDQGFGVEELMEPALFMHGASGAIPLYALAENARRHRLGMGLEEYRLEIGKLFAPFTRVAAANPHSAAPVERSAEELATVTDRNRIVAEPYPRMTVARDQVNQAAAVIVASAGLARELGVPEDRWVHIHAVTAATELKLSQRPDLAGNPASLASVDKALERAGKGIEDVRYIDFYSCFAIPVFNQCDHFGLTADDPRGLTLTGGLPFFGGAGNNYSAHAIAEAVQKVRGDRGSFALVGANGGWMSKYATGIYSTEPADWSGNDRFAVLPKATDKVPLAKEPVPAAVVETYTINRGPKGAEAIFIGRSDAGERVVGNADLSDAATGEAFESGEPFGKRLTLTQDERGRTVGKVV
ncbi:acetyl-CoA acetyltransferase [Erythrobacter sp. BLCC-B19]|uniref:acetyl-CoA acetyltransferase n=1 Tax=Erythrobacter sp. BLCC-B19 TaxID=3025315 RepID=UPI00235DEA7B|nr:acetyl-CoA acetyltransferase [Erythrobacter sp. BLCC-B19]WDA42697.1 acetyl-CoA acetyltransferase [Erythrobacter sp. BLCC-B19]